MKQTTTAQLDNEETQQAFITRDGPFFYITQQALPEEKQIGLTMREARALLDFLKRQLE